MSITVTRNNAPFRRVLKNNYCHLFRVQRKAFADFGLITLSTTNHVPSLRSFRSRYLLSAVCHSHQSPFGGFLSFKKSFTMIEATEFSPDEINLWDSDDWSIINIFIVVELIYSSSSADLKMRWRADEEDFSVTHSICWPVATWLRRSRIRVK